MVASDPSAGSGAANVRDRALAAATRLFAAHGFDGTPLQAVADAVGVSKPAVLHHFPSKEALYESVLEELITRWNDIVPRLLLAATAGDGRFDGIMDEMVTFFRADPDRARLLVREALDRPEAMRERLLRNVRPWVTAIADYVRKGQRSGEIPEDVDPEGYVLAAIQLVVGGIATAGCMAVLIPGAPAHQETRYVREMQRVARASLFVPREREDDTPAAPPETASPRPRPVARARSRVTKR